MKWTREQPNRFSLEILIPRARASRFCAIAAVALFLASASFADTGRIYPDAASVEPLGVGRSVPSVLVRSIDNEPFQLSKIASESGALLVFYRGGW